MQKIRVIELFAGIGGFRVGMEGFQKNKNPRYKVIWANQYEPNKQRQYAADIYRKHWAQDSTKHLSNHDINTIKTKDIPDHDILTAGFPCQDYSVANTLKLAGGLRGEKGVLWWNIEKILREKGRKKPKYLILENVDRLLKSPVSQRGRDFAIMLASLADLGYAVEWRVINAADYGMPQRRRRVFFIGYHSSTRIYRNLRQRTLKKNFIKKSVLGRAFPFIYKNIQNKTLFDRYNINGPLDQITKNFNLKANKTPFKNAGVMINRNFWTTEVVSDYSGPYTTISDILEMEKDVPKEFYVDKKIVMDDQKGWKYHKSGKKIERIAKDTGFKYTFAEGGMNLTDSLNKPSRTIITGEGGPSPSRTKHLIQVGKKYRRLTPTELERLSMFPSNFTQEGINKDAEFYPIPDNQRAFLIGNALVTGVVNKIAKELIKDI